MIYGYARVSTDGQSVDAQVRQLRAAGARQVFRATAAGGFSRRFIPPSYRLPGRPSPGTPKILMLSADAPLFQASLLQGAKVASAPHQN